MQNDSVDILLTDLHFIKYWRLQQISLTYIYLISFLSTHVLHALFRSKGCIFFLLNAHSPCLVKGRYCWYLQTDANSMLPAIRSEWTVCILVNESEISCIMDEGKEGPTRHWLVPQIGKWKYIKPFYFRLRCVATYVNASTSAVFCLQPAPVPGISNLLRFTIYPLFWRSSHIV